MNRVLECFNERTRSSFLSTPALSVNQKIFPGLKHRVSLSVFTKHVSKRSRKGRRIGFRFSLEPEHCVTVYK